MRVERDPTMVGALGKLMEYYSDNTLLNRYYDTMEQISHGQYEEAFKTTNGLIATVRGYSGLLEEKRRLKRDVISFLKDNLSSIRGFYLPEDQLNIGYFVNACVEFVEREGHYAPGFWVDDGSGGRRKCTIRWSDVEEGDFEKLLIVGWREQGNKVVLDPRPEKGDIIRVRVRGFGEQGEPRFRFMMYDGFLDEIEGIEPGYFYEARIIHYYRGINVKRRPCHITNFGEIRAEPIKRLEKCESRKQEMEYYRIHRS